MDCCFEYFAWYNKGKSDVNGFSKFYVYWVGRKYGGVVLSSHFFINGCFRE